MLQPPSINVIYYYNGDRHFDKGIHVLIQARLLKSCVAYAFICSSISWHIEDLHNRFSMCSTKPESDLKFV